MQELLNLLSSIHPLPPELREHLASILQIRELSKKEILLDFGQVCRRIYFVESGLFRCYYLHRGKEICSWFMQKNDTIASVGSFYSQTPSYEKIQALEPSVVHSITYAQLKSIYKNYPSFNFNGRVLTEKYYRMSEERSFLLKMDRAKERYRYFRAHHEGLAERLQRGYLASYLGIREWTLSRIRGESD